MITSLALSTLVLLMLTQIADELFGQLNGERTRARNFFCLLTAALDSRLIRSGAARLVFLLRLLHLADARR